MGFRDFAWTVFGGLAGLTVLVSSANAQTCDADSDCPKGFDCEVTAVSGCTAPAPAPEPAGTRPACDAGACAADAGAPAMRPACETKEYRSCVPGECKADSDCASGMVCHERRIGTCQSAPTPACAPGFKCPDFVPPMCTETVEHVCIPRYVLPCQQAADCGDGFTCEAHERCGCAGSTGSAGAAAPVPSTPASGPTPTPSADAGIADFRAPDPQPPAAQPLPPPDCKCEPTPEKYCKVIERACRADVECPANFYCQQSAPATNPATPAIECDVPAGQGDAGVCAADRALPAQPPPVNVYRCAPRFENVDPDYGTANGGGTGGAGAPIPTSAPVPGQAPGKSPATAPPTVPGQAADAGMPVGESGEQAAGPHHVRACSVAVPGGAEGGGVGLGMVLLALGWTAARRRRGG